MKHMIWIIALQSEIAFHVTTRSGPQGCHKEVAESHISQPFSQLTVTDFCDLWATPTNPHHADIANVICGIRTALVTFRKLKSVQDFLRKISRICITVLDKQTRCLLQPIIVFTGDCDAQLVSSHRRKQCHYDMTKTYMHRRSIVHTLLRLTTVGLVSLCSLQS